jgi:hypothetical protein
MILTTFTLTVLSRLDPRRKAAVVGFLYEAGLIGSPRPTPEERRSRSVDADDAKVDLRGG